MNLVLNQELILPVASLKMASVLFSKHFIRRKHWRSAEYQYWQQSKIPTMHFQKSLPRLPIPNLAKTCERYLAAQKPLLIDEAYGKTESNVIRFKDTVGKNLQELLIAKDKRNKHTSYISEPWFDMYLSDRKPLPINYNPTLVFHNDPKLDYNNQLLKATNMLISSARFFKSLRDNLLEPEVFHLNPKKSDTEAFRTICSKVPSFMSWYVAYLYKAFPLDMSQYHNLFNTTRIPEMDKDRILQDSDAKHVTIQKQGHFYTFNVFDESWDILPQDQILANLKYIIDDNSSPAEYPVGILTTLERNSWASLRHHLSTLDNEKALKIIDTALFNICLDDSNVNLQDIKSDTDYIPLARQFIHGDGKNRWFDKSFSLIFSKDGVAGLNFEHSWGDGVAVLRYFQDIHNDSIRNPQVNSNSQPHKSTENNPQKLVLNIDDKIKIAIKEAIESYRQTCNSLDINILQVEGIGKCLCKNASVSPDAIMQLGFQDAYYKMTGKCIASYESCSTAAFKHGRTEAIRPCSIKTKAYSVAVNSSHKPLKQELLGLIDECSKYHTKLTKEAAMGQGFDRHLYALKLLAEQNGHSGVNIFDDPAYVALNHNVISSSTLNSPSVLAGGFGPVVQNGFGIAYSMREDSIGTLVTNFLSYSNGKDFIRCLEDSYKEIREILFIKK